jgi:hypothetical protein
MPRRKSDKYEDITPVHGSELAALKLPKMDPKKLATPQSQAPTAAFDTCTEGSPLQATQSRVSVQSASIQTKKHGVSIITAQLVEEPSRQPSEREKKRETMTFSPSIAPFPLLSALKSSVKKSKLQAAFNNLKLKLRLVSSINHQYPLHHKQSLDDICYSLGRIDPAAHVATSDTVDGLFEPCKLQLEIKLLNNTRFELVLPPGMNSAVASAGSSVTAGDTEEQGSGGTCDQFIGMLPESCREISQKASPLGLVPKLLPYGTISSEARYVGSCFWIWLCIVDGKLCLSTCMMFTDGC